METRTEEKRVSTRSISQLPEDIIHHVLSYLETKEAARTSIFCKTWYTAWLTCPTLSFRNTSQIFGLYKLRYKSNLFQFIERTLKRYKNHKIHIEQFNLCLIHLNFHSIKSHMDQWIRIALRNGVKRLELVCVLNRRYTLPAILFEAKSLRELSLSGKVLMLNKRVDGKVMFNHLRKLSLSNIYVDDDMFESIIESCLLIENLCVKYCEGLKRIKVIRLYKLKEFSVWGGWKQVVEIEAPDLQYLDCHLYHGSVDLYKTVKLRYLSCMDHKSTFSQVDYLKIRYLNGHRMINFRSDSVKHIVLKSTGDSREVDMGSLELHGDAFYPDLYLTNEFCELIQLLAKVFTSQRFLVSCSSDHTSGWIRVRNFPNDSGVEIVDLDYNFSRPLAHSNILSALFLTCHPKAIIVHWNRDPVGFLYKYLIEKRRCETKSWYQKLKKVKLFANDDTIHQWRPIDGRSLPVEPQDWRIVWFKLKWEAA